MKKIFLLLALLGSVSATTVQTTAYHLRGVTALGTRTRAGTAALSRDLLASIPLGSVIRLHGVGGPNCGGFDTGPLDVTDKMGAGILRTVDVWLPTPQESRRWGRCAAQLEVVRRAK